MVILNKEARKQLSTLRKEWLMNFHRSNARVAICECGHTIVNHNYQNTVDMYGRGCFMYHYNGSECRCKLSEEKALKEYRSNLDKEYDAARRAIIDPIKYGEKV